MPWPLAAMRALVRCLASLALFTLSYQICVGVGPALSTLSRAAADFAFELKHDYQWRIITDAIDTPDRIVVFISWELNDADPRAGTNMTYKGLLAPDVFARMRPGMYSYMRALDTRKRGRGELALAYVCWTVSRAGEQQFESDRARAESEIAADIDRAHMPNDGVRTWVNGRRNRIFYTQFDRLYDTDADADADADTDAGAGAGAGDGVDVARLDAGVTTHALGSA
jgi:hypothetical protein